MDAQQFLAEFGHIANAPGGVARLRELVLHLAVSGDLVATESPVDALPLLDAIEQQKREHTEKKKVISKQTPVSHAVVKAPPHWAICRLGDLALTITGGGTPSKNQPAYWGGDIPWASVKDMKELKFLDDTEDHITAEGLKNSSSNLIPPGRMIVCTRMGLGKIAINRVALAINQDLKALELPKEVNSEFFLILYKTREVSGTGTTVSGIKQDQLLALPAALPPVEEQSRIVAKVDELMALCDTLEAQQQARRELQNKLRQSTLQAVANATSPHDLQVSWTRLNSSFHQLFSSPKDIGALRTLILELAVQGLLTEQKDTDVPAELNVAEIRRLSPAITETGRRKRPVIYRSVEDGELGYQLPKGWTFVRCGELVRVLNGRAYSKPELLDKGTPVLRVGNLFTSKDWYYSNLELEADKYCDEGDLLYAWSASFGPFIWAGPRVIFHYHIWKLDLFSGEHLSKDFLYLVLQERTEAIKSSGHGISMAHMTKEKMEQLPIAVPPLDEQHRIVARVSELMRFCEEIERQLRESEKVAERFAASAIAAVTGITIEQKEEPMKAPQTELIAPLRLGTAPDIKAQAPLATILARHNGEMRAKDLWQRFGGEIDAFYAQLKTEVAHGWILEPAPAEMREKPADTVRA